MNLKLALLTAMLCAFGQTVQAGPPMPFHADSLDGITAERKDKPFLLVLWSLDCAPCRIELRHIGEARQVDRAPDVVLVSTDTPDRADRIEYTLSEFGLEGLESWVFDDPVPERLRHAIDPEWYGELPRAYFYDKDHSRMPYSGAISRQSLDRMAAEYDPPGPIKEGGGTP